MRRPGGRWLRLSRLAAPVTDEADGGFASLASLLPSQMRRPGGRWLRLSRLAAIVTLEQTDIISETNQYAFIDFYFEYWKCFLDKTINGEIISEEELTMKYIK